MTITATTPSLEAMGMPVRLAVPYEEARARVTAALKEEGFGVLTEIDVQATMKSKIDQDVEPQVILGACNPHLAFQALQSEPGIGLLLPCNVVVRREHGRTLVSALDPQVMVSLPDSPALQGVADDATSRLRAALDAVAAAA
jgi:uncharacterized protein (DUF302 family)